MDIYRVKDSAGTESQRGKNGGATPLKLIVLDAGHGGHDSGATGPNGVQEKDVVLDVTRRAARMIEDGLGIKVALTRATDVFVPLHDRTNFANKQRADLFIAIHANAHPQSVSEGVETFFLSSEATDNAARQTAALENNVVQLESPQSRQKTDLLKSILWDMAQSEFQQESSFLAETVQDSMTQSLRLVNRGVGRRGHAGHPDRDRLPHESEGGEEARLRRTSGSHRARDLRQPGRVQASLRSAGAHGADAARQERDAAVTARADGRAADQLRPIKITRDYLRHPEGSVLVEFGDTKVICTASIEEKVPPFLKGQGKGWVTAEYGMLPRSTNTRMNRERGGPSGRSQEIQRLVGRSLRAVVEMAKLGERTVWVDCDVIQADGGTRTAAITGSFIAMADAIGTVVRGGALPGTPVRDCVAAISVGIVGGAPALDLNYLEDSGAEVDMNVVMTGAGAFVEVQGTAEQTPFGGDSLAAMLALAEQGIGRLIALQRRAVDARGETSFVL